jgi:hypothetical protein
MSAFYADLAAGGAQDDVLAMTFSEFGRRVEENGSAGTDHGTAAPMMLFGGGLNGGLYGDAPDLANLNRAGNMHHSIDFRQAYATILTQWFGLPTPDVEGILYGSFEPLGFVASPVATDGGPSAPLDFVVEGNYPNPFVTRTTLRFRLGAAGPVRVRVFDLAGREVRALHDGPLPAGTHDLPFEARDLASGTYLYQIDTPSGSQSRPMTLVR